MNKATWTKNGKTITGSWIYSWGTDSFYICLDSKDRITGRNRKFYVDGEHPEFNGWKLIDHGTLNGKRLDC